MFLLFAWCWFSQTGSGLGLHDGELGQIVNRGFIFCEDTFYDVEGYYIAYDLCVGYYIAYDLCVWSACYIV